MGKAAIAGGILLLLGVVGLAVVGNETPSPVPQEQDIGSAEQVLKKFFDTPTTAQRTSAAILDQSGGWRFAHLVYEQDNFGSTERSSYCVIFYNSTDGKTLEWKRNIAATECGNPPTPAEISSLEADNGWPGATASKGQ